ncbi:hypothetical protein STAN_0296 [Streptomyces sp. CBMAI 2042]|nr:hypothetical protein STAN_0296 [Streptomyces sp. CBMAI 2042]
MPPLRGTLRTCTACACSHSIRSFARFLPAGTPVPWRRAPATREKLRDAGRIPCRGTVHDAAINRGCPAGSATPEGEVPEHADDRCAPARGSGEFDSSVGQSAPVRSQLPAGCGTLVATAPPGSPVPVGRFCAPPVALPLPMTVFQGRTGPVSGALQPFSANS